MKSRLPTSTQPEPAQTKIYGSSPVEPLKSSNQPEVIPTKVYGVKATPQIRVRRKADKSKTEVLIPFADFNPAIHVAVD